MADILMVIAPENFRDEEYFHVREELENAGHTITVASTQDVAVSSVDRKEVVVDVLINEADVADYDALVFSGGQGASVYFEHEKILEMCYQIVEQGKLLAAICMAPGILARAGVLSGKNATAFESEKPSLDEAGALTSDSHVVVDGQIITADGPQASRDFGKKIAEALAVERKEEPAPSNQPTISDTPVNVNDEGFSENKPYYGEDGKDYEKRSDENV